MSRENKQKGSKTLKDLIQSDLHVKSSKKKKTNDSILELPTVLTTEGDDGNIGMDEEALQRESGSDCSEDENKYCNGTPAIKLNEKGEIVIDEKSLVVQDRALKKRLLKLKKSVATNTKFLEGESGFYKKRKSYKYWSKEETALFHKSLNTMGSNFHAMTFIFPERTREELKRKFHNEDKRNPELIDKLMTTVSSTNVAGLKKEYEDLKNLDAKMEVRKTMRQKLKTTLKNQIPYFSAANTRQSRTKRPHQLEHTPIEKKKVRDVYSRLEKGLCFDSD